MQNLIQEYQLDVLKRCYNGRRRSLLVGFPKQNRIRILMIQGRPKIQMARTTNSLFKEIDISEAAGIFLCIDCSSRQNYFKLILKNKVLIFYERSKPHFDQLKIALMKLIERFHRYRESTDSSNSSNRSISHDCDEIPNLQYEDPEFNNDREVIDYVDDPYVQFQNSSHNSFNDLVKEIICDGGIKVDLVKDHKDKYDLILFNGQLWVANVKYGDIGKRKLHFGDRVVAVDGISVRDMFCFQESIRNRTKFSLTIQRLPKAKAFLYNKNKPNSINFLTKKSNFIVVISRTKWIMTEINGEFILDLVNQKHKDMIFSSSNKSNLVIIHPKEFVKNLNQARNSQHSCQI